MFPAWRAGLSNNDDDVLLSPITGGITNDLLLVTPMHVDDQKAAAAGGDPFDSGALRPVVVRTFGGGTDRFLDRAVEATAVLELNEQAWRCQPETWNPAV
jgi:ethanolamine kinase